VFFLVYEKKGDRAFLSTALFPNNNGVSEQVLEGGNGLVAVIVRGRRNNDAMKRICSSHSLASSRSFVFRTNKNNDVLVAPGGFFLTIFFFFFL
jgi:hypothetical protein